MREYSKEYLSTHDIDWYCFINGKPIHAASNGGNLPDKINDRERNSKNQIAAYKCEHRYSINDIEINTEYINERLKLNESEHSELEVSRMRNNYLRSFVDMARRGFYSFDREDDPESDKYHLIAWPKNNKYDIRVEFSDVFFKLVNFDLDHHIPSEPVVFNNLELEQ